MQIFLAGADTSFADNVVGFESGMFLPGSIPHTGRFPPACACRATLGHR